MTYAERKRAIYAEYARSYDTDREKFVGAAALERRTHFFCESLRNGDHVLDLGCGSGVFLASLADHNPRGRLIGVDISPEMLALARQRLDSKENVELREMDVSERLSFPDASFDLVIASNINYEVPDQERLLREIFRVLKPYKPERDNAQLAAGLLCVRDNSPVNQEYARLAEELLLWHFLTCDELIEIIKEAGFHIIGHRPVFIENKLVNAAILRKEIVFSGYGKIFEEMTRRGFDPATVSQGHIWIHAVKA